MHYFMTLTSFRKKGTMMPIFQIFSSMRCSIDFLVKYEGHYTLFFELTQYTSTYHKVSNQSIKVFSLETLKQMNSFGYQYQMYESI